MNRYTLPPLPQTDDVATLKRWLERELRSLSNAVNVNATHQFDILHAVPTKLKVGLVVYADGTDWDPGSGEGTYEYTSGGWVKL